MRFFSGLVSFFWMSSGAFAFTVQIDTSGKALNGWKDSNIGFDVNYASCPPEVTRAQIDGAIDAALSIWNGVPESSVRLSRGSEVVTTVAEYKAQTGVASPLITCDTTMSADISGSGPAVDTSNIPAVSQILRVDSSGRVAAAIVYINAEAGKAANIKNLINLNGGSLVTVVLAHEIGHALGLGHSSEQPALMYYDASSKKQLGLTQDDMHGITYLYPRHELLGNGLFGCGTLAFINDRRRNGESRPPIGPGFAEYALYLGLFCLLWAIVSVRSARGEMI